MNRVVNIFLEKVKNMGFIITFEGKLHINFELGHYGFNLGYNENTNVIFSINPSNEIKEFYDWGECEQYMKEQKSFIQILLM